MFVKLAQMFGHQVVATDIGLGGDPPDPVPKVIVNGSQRRGAGRDRWSCLLRVVKEEILHLCRPGQQHLIDGKVTHRLPLLAQRCEGCHEPGHVCCDRVEV